MASLTLLQGKGTSSEKDTDTAVGKGSAGLRNKDAKGSREALFRTKLPCLEEAKNNKQHSLTKSDFSQKEIPK